MKPIYHKCVILSTFIYHSDVTVCFSFFIGYHTVQLPDFERGFVSFIIETHHKMSNLAFFFLHR